MTWALTPSSASALSDHQASTVIGELRSLVPLGAPFPDHCRGSFSNREDNQVTAELNCYVDGKWVDGTRPTINPLLHGGEDSCPPAPASACGDDTLGAPPPLWEEWGQMDYGIVADDRGTLDGNYNNFGTPDPADDRVSVAGCFGNVHNDLLGPNVYVLLDLDANLSSGAQYVWRNRPNCDPPIDQIGNPSDITTQIAFYSAETSDSDGDRCDDTQELGSEPTAGGKRDNYNPYDYFNPTRDGQNRVDDILAVVGQYYKDGPGGKIAIDAAGGTFTITVNDTGTNPQTTNPIAFDATPATVDTELEALSNVGADNATVTIDDGAYAIALDGATMRASTVNGGGSVTTDASGLTGGADTAVVTGFYDRYDDPTSTNVTSGAPAKPVNYHPDYNRTALAGQDDWNLGPPDGVQRVDDIIVAVHHYFHDCHA